MKTLRYLNHRFCRFIYYFGTCPTDYRKDYKTLFVEGLACAGLCIVGVLMMMLMVLMA